MKINSILSQNFSRMFDFIKSRTARQVGHPLMESLSMSFLYLSLAFILTFIYGMVGHTSVKTKKAPVEKKLVFSDRLVKGKHQVPGEGLVTVENEKPILNLLTLRTDFKDRREKEKLRD